jgi:hypothetical protein
MTIPLPRVTSPRPKTLEAILFCGVEKKFKKHLFDKIEEILAESGHRQATKFIYRCECGQARVWGSED